jgi:epoxyqueuosine reductase
VDDVRFAPREFAPNLAQLAEMSEEDFRARFRNSPVKRAKFGGFQRNVKAALKNTRLMPSESDLK